jgi:hypothetical protein
MNNKIIFLDIDGVLNYHYFYQSKSHQRNVKKNGYDMVNQICKRNLFWLGLLCRLTKSKVVLSSTWKYWWNEDGSVRKDIEGHDMVKTDSLFRKNGINIISVTRKGKLSLENNYEMNEDKITDWCNKPTLQEFEKNRDFILQYARGTQIMEWIERNHFEGKYVILEDDYQDVEFYKDLEKRLVITSFYKKRGGFGFRHFIKALWKLR